MAWVWDCMRIGLEWARGFSRPKRTLGNGGGWDLKKRKESNNTHTTKKTRFPFTCYDMAWLGMAMRWHGHGYAMAWVWPGMGMRWHGYGMAVGWLWYGMAMRWHGYDNWHGMAMRWDGYGLAWVGGGIGIAWVRVWVGMDEEWHAYGVVWGLHG